MTDETMVDDDEHGDNRGGDQLSLRIRSSIDGDATPLTLDDIRRRVDEPAPDAGTRTDLATVSHEGGPAASGLGSSAWSEPGRRRPLVWLGAAAAIVLLVGIGALVATRPSGDAGDDLDVTSGPGTTTLETAPPTSTVVVEPAAGGLYDPTSTVLDGRRVLALVSNGEGRLFVSYERLANPPGDGDIRTESGVLIVDAGDGAVIADRRLDAPLLSAAATGSTLWLAVGDLSTGAGLWRIVDGGQPERVDTLPGSDMTPVLAASDGGLWVRQVGRLQHRDPDGGELIADSSDRAYDGFGALAVAGDGGWTVAAGPLSGLPSSTLVPFDGVAPGTVLGPDVVTALAIVDGTVIAGTGRSYGGEGSTSTITLPADGGTTVAESEHEIQGIDGRDGRAWVVANDLASSSDIDVITFELGGQPRWVDLGLPGISPTVAAIDQHHALVCASVADQSTTHRSACRLLDARTTPDAAPSTTPETLAPTIPLPSSTTSMPAVVTSTTPPLPDVVVTTTTRAPRPLNPAGISGSGLDPIDFNMDQNQMLAATTEPFRRANPQCGHEVYLDSSGGVEAHLFPLVEGDGSSGARFILGAVSVKTPAYSTAAGARVGMTTAQLEALVPGMEHLSPPESVGGTGSGQYVQKTGQGSLYYGHANGVVTEIIAAVSGGSVFFDLC